MIKDDLLRWTYERHASDCPLDRHFLRDRVLELTREHRLVQHIFSKFSYCSKGSWHERFGVNPRWPDENRPAIVEGIIGLWRDSSIECRVFRNTGRYLAAPWVLCFIPLRRLTIPVPYLDFILTPIVRGIFGTFYIEQDRYKYLKEFFFINNIFII